MTKSITLELSEKVADNLIKLAQAEHLSLDKFIEVLAERYQVERMLQNGEIELPDAEELAAVQASIIEAEKPDAVWYTDDELDSELEQLLMKRKAIIRLEEAGQS